MEISLRSRLLEIPIHQFPCRVMEYSENQFIECQLTNSGLGRAAKVNQLKLNSAMSQHSVAQKLKTRFSADIPSNKPTKNKYITKNAVALRDFFFNVTKRMIDRICNIRFLTNHNFVNSDRTKTQDRQIDKSSKTKTLFRNFGFSSNFFCLYKYQRNLIRRNFEDFDGRNHGPFYRNL